jgi:hypothetical protein
MGSGFSGATLATSHNADGRLELVARNGYGVLIHIWQVCPGCGWSSWSSLGIAGGGQAAVARNGDGRLEIFVLHPTVMHSWQVVPNGGWSGWHGMGGAGEPAATMSAEVAADGRMVVGWRDATSRTAYVHRQASANGDLGWIGPTALPWTDVSAGPAIELVGGSIRAATCAGDNTVVSATLADGSGAWTAGSPSSSSACRSTAVLDTGTGPQMLVLGDGVLIATPGSGAHPF